jgi:hypothetical protein
MPVAYWCHEHVDRQLAAADELRRALDPAHTAERHTA